MSERTRNIIVGLTALAGVVGLAGLMLLFGYLGRWMESGYVVQVRLPRAAGVGEGSRATFNGLDIGRVSGVRLGPPPAFGVIATLQVRQAWRLPANVAASVESPLLGGSPSIAFYLPEPPAEPVAYLPTDGSAAVTGDVSTPFSNLAGEVEEVLQGTLKELTGQFERTQNQIDRLAEEWTRVGSNLESLTEPRDLAAVEQGELPGNIATLIARTDAGAAELRQIIHNLNTLIEDPQFQADIRQTLRNSQELSGRLNQSADRLNVILDRSGEQIDRLLTRYVALADEIGQAVSTIDQVAQQARHGQGTVGKLLNDPSLYNNLDDSAERLEAALIELRLLIEKWQQEGVPLRLFN